MIFKRLNRTLGEQVFIVMQANVSGIAADDVVCLETAAASVDGVKINQAATAALAAHGIVGVADAAIANGAYGLVQVYGPRSTSRIILTDSTQSSLAMALKGVSSQDYFSTVASTVGVVPFAVLLESLATGTTTASQKIFLRMM
jgi:hypothetical protein